MIRPWIDTLKVLLLMSVLMAAAPALAGPPLLCHPFDIGTERSLPWDGAKWWQGRADYQLANLVADTEASDCGWATRRSNSPLP